LPVLARCGLVHCVRDCLACPTTVVVLPVLARCGLVHCVRDCLACPTTVVLPVPRPLSCLSHDRCLACPTTVVLPVFTPVLPVLGACPRGLSPGFPGLACRCPRFRRLACPRVLVLACCPRVLVPRLSCLSRARCPAPVGPAPVVLPVLSSSVASPSGSACCPLSCGSRYLGLRPPCLS
jgi:hypothetical protein